MTYDEIVSDYIRRFRDSARAEMREFEKEPNLTTAIRRAALCELPDRRRHPHQRRIPRKVLEEAELRLQAAERSLAKAPDFDSVHRLVKEMIGGIDGIGVLTAYDIAHRIGAYLERIPTRVYLHAGTRAGAKLLGIQGDAFDPTILPSQFSRLSAAEIEDCLCIYKSELSGGQPQSIHHLSGCAIKGRGHRCLT
jgi:hypothetical protein